MSDIATLISEMANDVSLLNMTCLVQQRLADRRERESAEERVARESLDYHITSAAGTRESILCQLINLNTGLAIFVTTELRDLNSSLHELRKKLAIYRDLIDELTTGLAISSIHGVPPNPAEGMEMRLRASQTGMIRAMGRVAAAHNTAVSHAKKYVV